MGSFSSEPDEILNEYTTRLQLKIPSLFQVNHVWFVNTYYAGVYCHPTLLLDHQPACVLSLSLRFICANSFESFLKALSSNALDRNGMIRLYCYAPTVCVSPPLQLDTWHHQWWEQIIFVEAQSGGWSIMSSSHLSKSAWPLVSRPGMFLKAMVKILRMANLKTRNSNMVDMFLFTDRWQTYYEITHI